MTLTVDWPDQMIFAPTDEELVAERHYWGDMARVAEYDTWTEMRAQLESFDTWPLDDLLYELETVRILIPDQEDVIAELEDAIASRRAR